MDDLNTIGGLERLGAMIRGDLALPPLARLLDVAPTEAVRGAVALRGTPPAAAAGTDGHTHAGYCGAVLELAMAASVESTLGAGRRVVTQEYKTSLIRPIPPGTEVEARAQAQHSDAVMAVAVGELRGVSDNRLFATGSMTCRVAAPRD